MRKVVILSAALLALGVTSAAQAGSMHGKMSGGRWCLNQANVQSDNCSFASRRQCMAARSGGTDACTRSASRHSMTNGQGMRY